MPKTRTVIIAPTKDFSLVVDGKLEDGDFIIQHIAVDSLDCDISDALEWANSKPAGTILAVIEELVKEKL